MQTVWPRRKIVKEIATPKSENKWLLKEDSKEINEEKETAEIPM